MEEPRPGGQSGLLWGEGLAASGKGPDSYAEDYCTTWVSTTGSTGVT